MAERRVVVIDGGYASYEVERALLREAGFEMDIFPGERHDREGKIAFAEGADGLFVRWTVLDDVFFAALPGLRAVVRYGVGYDNVDLEAAARRGVCVANVQGYASQAVSDHALALILACSRALPQAGAGLRKAFTQPPRRPLFDLHDKTLGIVGLGQIGTALAAKARPLFRRVVAADPYVPPARFVEAGVERLELDRLLAESDVVSLHCNLTEETRHLIGRRAIAGMSRAPIVVNTARGPVVDEAALLEGLERGAVYAAGLDVFSEEPPPPELEPLLRHPHVFATGHYAWYSESATANLQRRAGENMAALLRGDRPEDCLTP